MRLSQRSAMRNLLWSAWGLSALPCSFRSGDGRSSYRPPLPTSRRVSIDTTILMRSHKTRSKIGCGAKKTGKITEHSKEFHRPHHDSLVNQELPRETLQTDGLVWLAWRQPQLVHITNLNEAKQCQTVSNRATWLCFLIKHSQTVLAEVQWLHYRQAISTSGLVMSFCNGLFMSRLRTKSNMFKHWNVHPSCLTKFGNVLSQPSLQETVIHWRPS